MNNNSNTGIIIKAYNSYYYVVSENEVTACKLRGRFKQERYALLVGDKVVFSKLKEGTGVIEEILPRQTILKRPLVANVDQVVLIFAAKEPDINRILVDRFLIIAEQSNLDIIVCINKIDLINDNFDKENLRQVTEDYSNIGYKIVEVSATEKAGIAELIPLLENKISVFTGPSGVGKSALLNAINPEFNLNTGQLSKKIKRGRHTTRYAEILKLTANSFLVDTPGFSFTEFEGIVEEKDLMYFFPEFLDYIPKCKFNTCLHFKEPDCAIKKAVEDDLIFKWRYESYLDTLEKIKKD